VQAGITDNCKKIW